MTWLIKIVILENKDLERLKKLKLLNKKYISLFNKLNLELTALKLEIILMKRNSIHMIIEKWGHLIKQQ